MRRFFTAIIATALITCYATTSKAKYIKGYQVIKVNSTIVTIQKKGDEPIEVMMKKHSFKVDDKVKYDPERSKIKKHLPPEEC